MKLTTIALASVLTLGSTPAFAQAGSSNDAAAAGGATGDRGRGWFLHRSQGRYDRPRGTRDSAQGSGSGDASAAAAGGATGGTAGAGSAGAVKSDTNTTGSSKDPVRR